MELTLTDVIAFLYHYAVVLTGAYATFRLGIDDRWILFGMTFVFALFWTGYFRFRMVPKLGGYGSEPDAREADEAS